MKKEKVEASLEDQVKEAIGKESLARLAKQPLAAANGGIAEIVRTACKEAAGFPDPLAAAIAKTRVACGSKAQKPTPAKAD